jgi:hypothetical protein
MEQTNTNHSILTPEQKEKIFKDVLLSKIYSFYKEKYYDKYFEDAQCAIGTFGKDEYEYGSITYLTNEEEVNERAVEYFTDNFLDVRTEIIQEFIDKIMDYDEIYKYLI